MTTRREKLITSVLQSGQVDQSPENLDTTVRLILGDMGQFFALFHQADGPGVMVLQPNSKNASMFYMTVEALHDWKRSMDDMDDKIEKIINAAIKTNPLEQACYLIIDDEGFRFFVIDYQQGADNKKKLIADV